MTTTTKKTTTKTVKANAPSIPNFPNYPFVYEVFDACSKQRTKAKKVEVLKRYAHESVMAVLIWNFDETIVSLLPEGEVPYGNTREDNSVTGSLSDKINDAVSITVIATGFDDVTSLEQIKENFLASTTESVSAVQDQIAAQETVVSVLSFSITNSIEVAPSAFLK